MSSAIHPRCHPQGVKTCVGIIANPNSSRDIRRLVSCATGIQAVERANIVMRIIITLGELGVAKVLMMPDRGGISDHVVKHYAQLKQRHPERPLPQLEFLNMQVINDAQDTSIASRKLYQEKVSAVVVLGGDGTHRLVAQHIGRIPIAGISTGTNNAFPEFYEATLVGMAVAAFVLKQVPADLALKKNKMIHVYKNQKWAESALVDLVISQEQWVGARALWKIESIREIYLSFCSANSIGMSAVGGLFKQVSRSDNFGLQIRVCDQPTSQFSIKCPIAPGLFHEVGVRDISTLPLNQKTLIDSKSGVIALDGERELLFNEQDTIEIEIKHDGPLTLDIDSILHLASERGLFVTETWGDSAKEQLKKNAKQTRY